MNTIHFLGAILLSIAAVNIFPDSAQALASPVVITNLDEAAVQNVLNRGGLITFACDGTLTLTNPLIVTNNAVLDASGHSVVFGGGLNGRILICSNAATAAFTNLAFINGSNQFGGAVYNDAGVLSFTSCTFSNNFAYGNGSPAVYPNGGYGGAIYNKSGTINFSNCRFITNGAVGVEGLGIFITGDGNYGDGSPGFEGYGGAIYNNGSVSIYHCLFSQNHSESGRGHNGSGFHGGGGAVLDAKGGAVMNVRNCTIVDSTFGDNRCFGGNGGDGGTGFYYPLGFGPGSSGGTAGGASGGAIANTGIISISRSLLSSNGVTGGTGGTGASFGLFTNDVAGIGGTGGNASGGGFFNTGTASITNVTFDGNFASGGNGGAGGTPSDTVSGTYGNGGNGGNGYGGSVYGSTNINCVNCTIAGGGSFAGTGGNGSTNGSDGSVLGQNLYGTVILQNSIVTAPINGQNASGQIQDLGFNISSDASCNLTNSGSLNNTDPMLRQLADNGGPTSTMAINLASPALDAIRNSSAPPTDQRGVTRPQGPYSDIGAFELAGPIVFTNLDAQGLQKAINRGGLIRFACDGTLTLASTLVITNNVVLDASGHSIILDGRGTGRILSSSNEVTAAFTNLMFINGSDQFGGAVYNKNALLSFFSCTFSNNFAYFTNPRAFYPFGGYGGAVYNNSGSVTFSACDVIGNSATGLDGTGFLYGGSYGYGMFGGEADGGAIFNLGYLLIDGCHFRQNYCTGGQGMVGVGQMASGGWGGDAHGGAIDNENVFSVSRCEFLNNYSIGGLGGQGASGDSGWERVGTNSASVVTVYTPGGAGNYGGYAMGGAIFNNQRIDLRDCVFLTNSVIGGAGGAGGPSRNSTNDFGGDGGNGGVARGGAIANSGSLNATNITLVSNLSQAGAGGDGGAPLQLESGTFGVGGNALESSGGSIYSSTNATLLNCTVVGSASQSGAVGIGVHNGVSTIGIGQNIAGFFTLQNSILSGPVNGNNASATIHDLGFNISSDASCNFTNIGSLNSPDPMIAPPADNGGPTLTMALLTGSPAIDAITNYSAPETDQRGRPRPMGTNADIGAYEADQMIPLPVILLQPPRPSHFEWSNADLVNFCLWSSAVVPMEFQWHKHCRSDEHHAGDSKRSDDRQRKLLSGCQQFGRCSG